jgi:phage baseplate assembly protein W
MAADDTRALKTPWQTRLGATGRVVQGYDALDQWIRTLCATQKGSVPQELELGINWLAILDMPADVARPLVVAGVSRVFRVWVEPKATLQSVEFEGDTCRVHYTPAGASEARSIEVAP